MLFIEEGITQTEIAEKVGVSLPYVNRITRGREQIVNKTFIKILDELAEVIMLINLVPLKCDDSDLDALIGIHQEPSVSRFISISDNYFNYVTETEGVCYYKIITDGILTGGIHSEINDKTMYLSICIDEKYRRLGIAEKALKKIISVMPCDVETIEANIEETNTPSTALFQKLGFQVSSQDDELVTYRKLL